MCATVMLTATGGQYVIIYVRVGITHCLPLHWCKVWFHTPPWSQRITACFLPSRKRLFPKQLYSTVPPTNITSPVQLLMLLLIAGGSGHTISSNIRGERWFQRWWMILIKKKNTSVQSVIPREFSPNHGCKVSHSLVSISQIKSILRLPSASTWSGWHDMATLLPKSPVYSSAFTAGK